MMGARSELWKFRLASMWENLKLRLFRPERHHDFFIVTATHNASRYIERHLVSIDKQHYAKQHVHHLIIDDASIDATPDRIDAWLKRQRPQRRVELVRNEHNMGGCANYARGFRQAPTDSIVLQIDGDDWLPDDRVLAYLNMVYHDRHVWMTYNTWARPDGRPALYNHAIPEEIISSNRTREFKWISSHLHSFRASLFSHVRDEDLIDPETGDYWRSAVDQSHYLPMFELAGHHVRHLQRVTYIYNLHEDSIMTTNEAQQTNCRERIRQLPKYEPLRTLV